MFDAEPFFFGNGRMEENLKDWYQKDEQEILKELHVTKEGLTAGQAETLLLEKGENVLMEGKKKSVLAVFAEQFCDLLVVILIAAAVISMFSDRKASCRERV